MLNESFKKIYKYIILSIPFLLCYFISVHIHSYYTCETLWPLILGAVAMMLSYKLNKLFKTNKSHPEGEYDKGADRTR